MPSTDPAYNLQAMTKDRAPKMTQAKPAGQVFNILAVVQSGRLQFEALLLAASLRASNPDFAGKLYLAEPQDGPLWDKSPSINNDAVREMLQQLGAEIIPFENKVFGQTYPHGNKIEALAALPDEPFLFLDTDTLILDDFAKVQFDFNRPSASMRREGTWPQQELYGPDLATIWRALYAKFGLSFDDTLDLSQPHDYWQRFLYFNAGWFFHASPQAFGKRFLDYAVAIHNDPPDPLVCQPMFPWLDQIALPLVIHSFGGGRPGPELAGLDGEVTCHYRMFPLLYARESDAAVAMLENIAGEKDMRKLLRNFDPVKSMVYLNRGRKARALFDQNDLPKREKSIRHVLRKAELWVR